MRLGPIQRGCCLRFEVRAVGHGQPVRRETVHDGDELCRRRTSIQVRMHHTSLVLWWWPWRWAWWWLADVQTCRVVVKQLLVLVLLPSLSIRGIGPGAVLLLLLLPSCQPRFARPAQSAGHDWQQAACRVRHHHHARIHRSQSPQRRPLTTTRTCRVRPVLVAVFAHRSLCFNLVFFFSIFWFS